MSKKTYNEVGRVTIIRERKKLFFFSFMDVIIFMFWMFVIFAVIGGIVGD
jgi:hypothetical protein